ERLIPVDPAGVLLVSQAARRLAIEGGAAAAELALLLDEERLQLRRVLPRGDSRDHLERLHPILRFGARPLRWSSGLIARPKRLCRDRKAPSSESATPRRAHSRVVSCRSLRGIRIPCPRPGAPVTP